MGSLLDSIDERFVNCLLIGTASFRKWLLLLNSRWVEELLLVALVWCLLPGEVGVVNLAHINTRDVDLGGGSNDISGVDSPEGNTVDLEWSGNKENTLTEALQVYNTLSTESTGEDDDDSSRLEGWSELGGPWSLAGLLWDGGILSWVPLASSGRWYGDLALSRTEIFGDGLRGGHC